MRRNTYYIYIYTHIYGVAWRNVTSVMNKDMEEKPKLRILKEIADLKLESRCALVKKRRERSMLMKLRGGTAAFQVEVGRWRGVKREERICKECQSGEIEDVLPLPFLITLNKRPQRNETDWRWCERQT